MREKLKLFFMPRLNASLLGLLMGLIFANVRLLYLGYFTGMDKPTLTQVCINIFVMSLLIYVMNRNYHRAKKIMQSEVGELKK